MSNLRTSTGQELIFTSDFKSNGGVTQSYRKTAGTITGEFYAIQFHEASTISATNTSNIGEAISGSVFPAGQTIFGSFTSITLTSGSFTAYRA